MRWVYYVSSNVPYSLIQFINFLLRCCPESKMMKCTGFASMNNIIHENCSWRTNPKIHIFMQIFYNI